MGTCFLPRGVKQPGRDDDLPPTCRAVVKRNEDVQLQSVDSDTSAGITIIIIIIIIIFIILSSSIMSVINFMQCIYNSIPETNPVPTVYTVLQLFCIYSLCYM
jgi:hypothetical protein